ncbi:MAG: hypothetical protein INR66_12760 [Gordonia polyisoprenivorans]|nr:hypothetical protein [Gordonia polyisoprenivorans]
MIDADGEVTGDSTGDKHGFVDYRDAPLDADPFILYAGLWAEARHLSERHGTNLDEQLMTTWLAHALNSAESAGESDVTKFERAMYDSFGSTPNKLTVESWWESAFSTELGHLWPAIAAVAADALAGVEVTHAVVDRHIGE